MRVVPAPLTLPMTMTMAMLWLAGCGASATSGPDGEAPADLATASADGGAGPDLAANACAPPTVTPAGGSVSVGTVTCHVTDGSGQPAAGMAAFVIGIDLAFPGKVGAAGALDIAVGHSLVAPSLRLGDSVAWPLLMAAVPAAGQDPTFVTAPLPAVGAALTPGAVATSGDVSLSVPVGATVLIDQLDFATPDQQLLRAVTLPAAALAAYDHGQGLAAIIGVAPEGTVICPPAPLTLPNLPGWPAGTAVEIDLLGTDVQQQWAPFGAWQKASDAAVSADGKNIVTVAGGGLRYLGTLGIRKKG